MKHLKFCKEDAQSFIVKVISHKSEKADKGIKERRKDAVNMPSIKPTEYTYPERCKLIFNKNRDDINRYDYDFTHDEWYDIKDGISNNVTSKEQDCKDYSKLYSYNLSIISDLRNELIESNDGETMCPICQVVPFNTFDHYIPKDNYPLYIVHPRNLIPCCSICNGHKSKKNVLDDGRRKYWNAYLDNESKRYLYCTIIFKNNIPYCEFRIEQGSISNASYKIIKNTFDDLRLVDTLRDGVSRYVTSLKNTMTRSILCGHYSEIKECIDNIRKDLPYSDNNDIETICKLALLDSDDFIKLVQENINNLRPK